VVDEKQRGRSFIFNAGRRIKHSIYILLYLQNKKGEEEEKRKKEKTKTIPEKEIKKQNKKPKFALIY
jgi:hypothetical protein